MSEAITPTRPNVTRTGQRRVACDGPADSKHPRVYLTMVDDTHGQPVQVVCPYCGKPFVFDATLPANNHH